MKIALDKRPLGWFLISEQVAELCGIDRSNYGIGLVENKDFGLNDDSFSNDYRSHPKLIKAIIDVGEENAGNLQSMIRIVEIPDGVDWVIETDADGVEFVREKA